MRALHPQLPYTKSLIVKWRGSLAKSTAHEDGRRTDVQPERALSLEAGYFALAECTLIV